MTAPDLIRFVDAQAPVFSTVLEELRAGCKKTHWMWFVFPQLIGLGKSPMSQYFGIKDLSQAERYISDPLLGKRLLDNIRIVTSHKRKSALEIFGSPDDDKFRSCVTLFREVRKNCINSFFFTSVLEQFYEGRPDEQTLKLLGHC